jgi:hypothetical protein
MTPHLVPQQRAQLALGDVTGDGRDDEEPDHREQRQPARGHR